VILVAHFIAPASETSSGVNASGLELGEELLEDTLTLQGWGWVTVIEAAVVGGNNLVFWFDHLSVDQTLDGISQNIGLVDWLLGRFRDFQHDGPVWTFLRLVRLGLAAVCKTLCCKLDRLVWLVVWGVVGEDGGAVERAVVFGEVELSRC